MAYTKAQLEVLQQIAATGLPLVGGSISAYVWNTTDPTPMYTDSAGGGSATSFTLNSLGMPQSAGGTAVDIFLNSSITYKFIIRDSLGSQVGPTIGPVEPWPASSEANLLSSGFVGDGTADDTALAQAFLDDNRNVYCPGGTYLIYGDGLQMSSNSRLYGDGPSTIFRKFDDDNAYVVYASSKSGVVIENIACDGNRQVTNDYTNSKFGIYFNDCDNSRVQGCYVYGCLADGIVVEYGENNVVIGNHAYDNNKDGIYCSGAEDVTVTGNACWNNGSNSTGGGIAVSATWGATVGDNVCADNEQFDILLSRGSRHCTIIGNSGGAHLTGQAPLSIYCLGEPLGGTLHGVDYGDGTTYYGASDCVIANNSFTAEMRLELLSDSIVTGNNINGSNDIGLWLYGCTRVTAESNRISDYTNSGITLSASAKNGTTASTYCTVNNNTIYKSGGVAASALSKSGTNNAYFGNTLNSTPLETGGAWTPVLTTDGTAPTMTVTATGSYAIAGDLVWVRAQFTLTAFSGAGTGNLIITGWPFQSLIEEQAFLPISRLENTQSALTMQALGVGVSSTIAYIYYTPTTTGSHTALTSADGLKNGFSFTVNGCYRIGAA